MSRWWEFVITVAPGAADEVAALLMPLAYGGVVQEPALTLEPGEEGFSYAQDQPTVLKAYLPVEAGAGARQELLTTLQTVFPDASVVHRELEAQEWSSAWRDFFRVRRVGRIVVQPEWLTYTPRPDDVVVLLEPGMAFGTGDHQTTRACLRALQQHIKPDDRVIDLGTGSGVLAIAAVKLGAAAVLALDTDPLAISATQENCARNGVEPAVNARVGSIDLPEVAAWGKADLLLANLNSQLHLDMAEAILHCLKPGGLVIASGIGAASVRRVTAAYRRAGASAIAVRRQGEWRSLLIFSDALSSKGKRVGVKE